MTNHIKRLERKYRRAQPEEASTVQKKIKQEQRHHARLQKAEPIILTMHLKPDQAKGVRNLINTFRNFKQVHGNLSEEAIITCFCLYYKKKENPSIQIDQYSISKRYGITHSSFETVCCRIIEHYMKRQPLIPVPTTKYDHSILIKG